MADEKAYGKLTLDQFKEAVKKLPEIRCTAFCKVIGQLTDDD